MLEVYDFTIDKDSSIINNSASIGGGIRIINNDITVWKYYSINCTITNNFAEIYGNNIGTIPTSIFVYVERNKEGDYVSNHTDS